MGLIETCDRRGSGRPRKKKDKDIDHSQTSYVSKLIIQQGHKVDCPATICVKEAFILESYKRGTLLLRKIPLLHIQLASQSEVQ